MNKYTRLYLNYTKCGPFFNDYMGEFLVSIYRCTDFAAGTDGRASMGDYLLRRFGEDGKSQRQEAVLLQRIFSARLNLRKIQENARIGRLCCNSA